MEILESFLRFWKRAGFVPLYVRQTASELTGEHTCVMVRGLNSSVESEMEWLGEFAKGSSASLFFVMFFPLRGSWSVGNE